MITIGKKTTHFGKSKTRTISELSLSRSQSRNYVSLLLSMRDVNRKRKIEDAVDVYKLIPELLDLNQIEHLYNLNANTIRKERWLQKQIDEQRLSAEKRKKIDTSGFGFKYKPVVMYRKLYFRRKDVEHFIKLKMQQSPEELLLMAGMAAVARSGKKYFKREL